MEDKQKQGSAPNQPELEEITDLPSFAGTLENAPTQTVTVLQPQPSISTTSPLFGPSSPSIQVANTTTPKSSPGLHKKIIISAVVFLGLALVGFGVFRFISDSANNKRLQKLALPSDYNRTIIPLTEIAASNSQGLALRVYEGSGSQFTVNGNFNLNGRAVVASTTRPDTPVAGELWYQNNDNKLYFYNGSQYVDLTYEATVGGALQTLSNALQNVVNSVQGQKSNVTFSGGNGIGVNGTTISNTGVVAIESGSPYLAITAAGYGKYIITDSTPSGVSLQATTPGTAQTGNINVTGTVIAGSFQGDGSGLNNLNASNIATGTLANARLSANVTLQGNTFNGASQLVQLNGVAELPAVNAVNLNNLNASNIATGTLANARLSANVTLQGNTFNGASQLVQLNGLGYLPAFNGSLLTNLNASNIATGTLADGRLSSNVALLGANQTFSGSNTFSSAINAGSIVSAGALSLRGNALSTIATTNNGFTTTIGFNGVSTGNLFYNFDAATTPGTYGICTTIGNCAGSGGGVTTLGGTTNRLAKFTGSASIGDTILTDTGTAVTVTPGSNSTATFRVQNSLAGNVLVVDTTNTRVAIAQSSASYPLDVAGDINSTTGLRVGGNLVCTNTGCSSVGGSGFYIQNGVSLQTGANFNIQSNSAGSVVGIVRGAASQTADLFQAQNSAGTVIAKVTATGNIDTVTGYYINGSQISSAALSNDSNLAKLNGNQSFTGNNIFTGTVLSRNAANSIGAFQIQNQAGTSNLLIADTQNTRVGIGVATPGYTLDVNGDINISSGSLFRMNGVAICGAAATCAPSAGSTYYIQNGTSLQTSANLNIQSGNAGAAVAVLRGAAGQTANLFEIQSATPSTLFAINSSGNIVVNALGVAGTATYLCLNGSNQVASCSSSGIGAAFVQGGNSFGAIADLGTNDNFDLNLRTNGTTKVTVLAGGNVGIGTTTAGTNNRLIVNAYSTVDNLATAQINTNAATNKGLVVQGFTSQSADLLELQNSVGTTLASVDSGGGIHGQTYGSANSGCYSFLNGTSYCSRTNNTAWISGWAVQLGTDTYTLGLGAATQSYLTVQSTLGSGTVAVRVIAQASQSVDIQQWQNSAGTTLSSIDASGNFFLAAGQSLKVTGSGAFPSSPTEGQVYYRTDTKQLYVYANSKWQADRSTATLIVAASNSQNKEKADYVATGTNDETQINAAISALPSTGGSVVLLDGTYNIGSAITMNKAYVTLTGQGNSTILKRVFDSSTTTDGVIKGTGASTTLSSLKIDGNKATYTNANDNAIYYTNTSSLTTDVTIINPAGNGIAYTDVQADVRVQNSYITGATGNGINNTDHSLNPIFSNNVVYGNGGTGIAGGYRATISGNSVYSNNNGIVPANLATITGNNVYANTTNGIDIPDSSTVTGNTVSSNGSVGINLGSNSTITGNVVSSNGVGIKAKWNSGGNNTISSNTIISNTGRGIENGGDNTLITGNTLTSNGGSGSSSAIYASSLNGYGNYVRIIGNYITDTAGTGYAIDIPTSNTAGVYLSGNTYSGTGASSINDLGTGTIYANQQDNSGNINFRGQAGVGVNTTAPSYSLQNTGAFVQGVMSTPAAPTVTVQGTAGATTWGYKVTAYDGLGETLASTETQVTTGNATLTGSNFNRIVPSRVNGAISYKIYRTTAGGTPSTTGLIGTLAGGAATFQFDDTGLAGSGSAPSANTTGSASIATYLGVNNTAPSNRLSINTATTADSLAQALISTGATTNKGLVIQGVASQNNNLLELQNSAGGYLTAVNKSGEIITQMALRFTDASQTNLWHLDGGTTAFNITRSGVATRLTLGGASNTVGETLIGFSGQTSDLLQIQNSSAANVLTVGHGTQPASVAGAGTAGGTILGVTGNKGGNTSGTTGQTAGAGSLVNITSGAGGDAPSGSTNGNGGSITLQGGAAGAGLGTAGVTGYVLLQNSGGNVGIGLSGPANKLEVSDTTTTNVAKFDGSGSTQCTVVTGTGWSCSSDERLKTNINAISPSDALGKIGQLRGVTYNWLSNPGGSMQDGFIAQAVQQILPELVTTDSNGYLSLNKDGLLPYLVGAIQQQQTQIEALQQQVNSNQAIMPTNATFASLNVSGATTLTNLTVTGSATIANLTVTGNLTTASLKVNGKIIGNPDTRGQLTIKQSETTAEYNFTVPYDEVPNIVATPTGNPGSQYWVSDITKTGFKVNLAAAPGNDLMFNFQAQQ
jgi:hypothetical protein